MFCIADYVNGPLNHQQRIKVKLWKFGKIASFFAKTPNFHREQRSQARSQAKIASKIATNDRKQLKKAGSDEPAFVILIKAIICRYNNVTICRNNYAASTIISI